MPVDLNRQDLESLTDMVAHLRPGQALISNDGLVIRRRPTTPGFDCGIGPGGYARSRKNTAAEAAEDMLHHSATLEHPKSLGGKQSFNDVEAAIESVRRGESSPNGPSPAAASVRQVGTKASLPSYRVRAKKAREALAKGDPATAVRQLEAIVEHASNNGSLRDVERAQAALKSIHENHEFESDVPYLVHNKIEIRTTGTYHVVYRNGKPATGPLTRAEAESRRNFLARQAAREEDMEAINREEAGEATLVRRAEVA